MRAASLLVFLVLAGSATAAVVGGNEEPVAEARAIAAEGSFSFVNSGDGMPIFSASEIAPGNSVRGTVEIANSGTLPAELTLEQHDVDDAPGLGGGELSGRLALQIDDVTAPASPVTIYAGPLAPMPPRSAGRLQPGQSRTYEFVATLPAAGPAGGGQNDVQGASTSVAYSWTASEAAEAAPPADPPPSQPPRSSPPGGGTAPAATPLRLRITRVGHAIRRGHLFVWAGCDSACSISARGRLRARSSAGQRIAKLRLAHPSRLSAGTQRLLIRVPNPLRSWIEANPSSTHLNAQLSLRAHNPAGERATRRQTVRVSTHPGR